MNAPQQASIVQRGTAFALALVVTLALLGGVNALATQDLNADALLVQRSGAVAAQV